MFNLRLKPLAFDITFTVLYECYRIASKTRFLSKILPATARTERSEVLPWRGGDFWGTVQNSPDLFPSIDNSNFAPERVCQLVSLMACFKRLLNIPLDKWNCEHVKPILNWYFFRFWYSARKPISICLYNSSILTPRKSLFWSGFKWTMTG